MLNTQPPFGGNLVMKFAGLFGTYLLAAALVIPSFAGAQESPPDINASNPIVSDPALNPTNEAPGTEPAGGAITAPAATPNAAAVELGEAKAPKSKKSKKSAKKELKKSKKAEKKHKKDAKKAKKAKKKKHHDA